MTTPSNRLKTARQTAGYDAAASAAAAFGWPESTYGGHENGNRGIPARAAERYARAFRVDASWILFGHGSGPSPAPKETGPPATRGFSEPSVEPFLGATENERTRYDHLAGILAPSIRHPSLFVVKESQIDMGLLLGDILVVDLKAAAQDGNNVIATFNDPQSGTGITLVCRYFRHIPIPGIATDPALVEGCEPAIMGVIKASFRPEGQR